ncbi:MAG: metallophosphoesterase [Gemmatimonadota bacterium]
MLTLLHISDLHFGPPYVPRVGAALLAASERLQADVIVASGDFTQRARRSQYAEARAFLDRLPDVPLVVTPGNHDVPLYRIAERIFSPYRWYREYISEELDTVLRREDAVIVSLNSTSPLRAITNGRISREQLAFCRRAFRDAPPDAVRIVVAHHHFAPAPDYERTDVMPRGRRALDAFTALDVDLIMGGHLHRAYIGNSLDVYPGMDRERGITIVECGTTTSRRGRAREREKNSFNVVRIGAETVRVTHHMYFDEVDEFAPISRHIFPRGRNYFSPAARAGDADARGSADAMTAAELRSGKADPS